MKTYWKFCQVILLVILIINGGPLHGNPQQVCDDSVNSLEEQFSRFASIKNPMGFNINPNTDYYFGAPFPCRHLQGMARGKSPDGTPYLFFTKSGIWLGTCFLDWTGDHPGELWVVKMGSRSKNGEILNSNLQQGKPPTSDSLVLRVLLDGTSKDIFDNIWPGWKHPGGVQLEDNVLVVALHSSFNPVQDKAGGMMLVDLNDPEKPVYLKTIYNFGDYPMGVVNAVGVTQICIGANIGKYLFVFGGSGAEQLTFGISSGNDLRDPNLTVKPFGTVKVGDSRNRIGETLNLVKDTNGNIYLFSFTNDNDMPNWGTNRAWLFDVVGGDYGIAEVTRDRYVILAADDSGNFGDAKAGASTYVSPSGKLILYMSSHRDYDGYVKVGEFAAGFVTIIGIGMKNDLWTRATLNSAWVQVPNSGSVIGVSVY
jgi:hypothetical protein